MYSVLIEKMEILIKIKDYFKRYFYELDSQKKIKMDLVRFIIAQKSDYEIALEELKKEKKESHWMWYIFPQINGLGFSENSKYFAIKNTDEATAFLNHPILGPRLIELSSLLLELKNKNARDIFGSPDYLKLKSSMTLFSQVKDANPVFLKVINKFFDGHLDPKTLTILTNQNSVI